MKTTNKSLFKKIGIFALVLAAIQWTIPFSAQGTNLFANISASPSSGNAPLNGVDFIISVEGSATGPITYKVDCTSNNSWDRVVGNTTENPITISDACDYPSAGDFMATVQVERQNLQFEGTVAIAVSSAAPPPSPTISVSLSASPNSGPVPLNDVDLTATVSGTATGNILYQFDCDNNGSFEHVNTVDTSSYAIADVCDYVSAGIHTARVRAGRQGVSSEATTPISVSTAPVSNRTLFIDLSANPNSGIAPLSGVSLTAAVSGTATGPIKYKFDCNSDGHFEFEIVKNETVHTQPGLCNYPSAGSFAAKGMVERDGLSFEGIAAIVVDSPTPTLSVTLSANPSSGPAPLADVDLTATVSGTATGDITYQFSCRNDNNFQRTIPSSNATVTATDVCTYNETGMITAGVRVIRQGVQANNTTLISVSQAQNNTIPVVTVSHAPQNPTTRDIVTVTANAQDPDGIRQIRVFVDGTLRNTCNSTTTCAFPGVYAVGIHTYFAQADDNRTPTNTGTSPTQNFTVTQATMAVDFFSTPFSGNAPLIGVDYTAVVSGTIPGTFTYKFDCTSDGIWDRTHTTSVNSRTETDMCNYNTPGTYTAKVSVIKVGEAMEIQGTNTIIVK